MKLKIISVVSLLTNLRWDLLNLIFLLILLKGGVVSKVIFMTRGGGGVRQKVIFDDEGGRGGKPQSDFWWRGGEGGSSPPLKKMTSFMNSPLLTNPCGQDLKSMKSRGQICPILSRRKRTFPRGLKNTHACKWILDNFPGIIRMSASLENCQKSICMHGCAPIHVERSYLLLEFHGVRIWECNIWPEK